MWKAEILRGRNMSFRKIEQTDLKGKGVTGLPDTPRLSTDAMQKKFDELAKDVIIPIYNEMIAQLEKDTAAADIGAKATEHFEEPTGKLQALLDVLAAVIYENQQARHTHENKLTLDEITENVKEGYDRLVTLLKGINSIDKVVTGSEDRIPTSKAIAEFVEELGGGDMVRAIYDTNRNGIVDDAEMLGGNAPEYYQPVHDEKLETNAKTIPEAINEVNAKEPDVLDTMEEVNANTDPGKPAGSLAVKELSRDLSNKFYDLSLLGTDSGFILYNSSTKMFEISFFKETSIQNLSVIITVPEEIPKPSKEINFGIITGEGNSGKMRYKTDGTIILYANTNTKIAFSSGYGKCFLK